MAKKWIDKTVKLPEAKKAIEVKFKDGDIGIGKVTRDLFRRDLKDEFITHWRYKQVSISI